MLQQNRNSEKYQRARAAMRRLVNADEDFNALLDWLNEERMRLLADLVQQHSGVVIHQHQGAVQVLDSLFAHIRDAQR